MSKLYFVQMTKNKLRFAVPLIALFVLIPALAALILTGPESDIKMADCIRQLHVWVPLFSTWWILLYAGDFFSHDGNELMYLIWKPYQIIVCEVAGVFGFMIAAVLSFGVLQIIQPFDILLLWQILSETWMMAGMAFFCCFLFQSTGAALMTAVLYGIYLNLFDGLHMFSAISIFPQQTLTIEADPLRMTAAIIAGSVFFAAGAACVKYRKVYW